MQIVEEARFLRIHKSNFIFSLFIEEPKKVSLTLAEIKRTFADYTSVIVRQVNTEIAFLIFDKGKPCLGT